MKKGFTLLEILITIVLLTAGLTSILRAMSMGMAAESSVAGSENNAIAKYLAQEKMEEIKDASSYANIDSFVAPKAVLSGDYSNFERAVTVSGDPKQVNVIVYWMVNSIEQNIDLVTLFADYDY